MDTNFAISLLNNTHCQQIIDLILHIEQVEFNEQITIDDQPDLLNIESNYFKTGGRFWGIIHNGEVIATIALILNGHRAGTVRKMFVKQAFRGKELNLAQQLLETLIAYAIDCQIDNLYLGTIERFKAAIRFYERNGFERVDVSELPSYLPKSEIDDLFYHLNLNDKT